MQKYFIRITASLALAAMLAGCSPGNKPAPMNLPDTTDIVSITVIGDDKMAVFNDPDEITGMVTALAASEPSGRVSVQDQPEGGEHVTQIDIEDSGGETMTVFYYAKDGDEYVEQPYQGVYHAAEDLSDIIQRLLPQDDTAIPPARSAGTSAANIETPAEEEEEKDPQGGTEAPEDAGNSIKASTSADNGYEFALPTAPAGIAIETVPYEAPQTEIIRQ